MDSDFSRLRRATVHAGLDEHDARPDPIEQFARWFTDAVAAGLEEPNAMTLATATAAGVPSARLVLMKEFDARGFVFFTSYTSRKARELDANPRAALVFFWQPLLRQVRVVGRVERASAEESDAYFHSRPPEAQLGAWASEQSAPLTGRAALDARFVELQAEYAGQVVPRPPHWGGYRLVPDEVEFWQGRPHRLHDRLLYQRAGPAWTITRLAP